MSETLSEARQLLKAVRITLAIVGVLALILGIAIIVWPGKVAAFVVGLIAAYLILAGLVYVGLGLFSKEKGGWARVGHLVLGLLYIAGGVIIFVNIASSIAGLAIFVSVLVGISWIIDGIVALSLLKDAGSKIWTLIYAVLSILAGAALFLWPIFGEDATAGGEILWWIFGISLVILGIIQLVRAVTLGKLAKGDAAAIKEAIG